MDNNSNRLLVVPKPWRIRLFNVSTVVAIVLFCWAYYSPRKTGFWIAYIVAGFYVLIGLITWLVRASDIPKGSRSKIVTEILEYEQYTGERKYTKPSQIIFLKRTSFYNVVTYLGILFSLGGVLASDFSKKYAWIGYVLSVLFLIIGHLKGASDSQKDQETFEEFNKYYDTLVKWRNKKRLEKGNSKNKTGAIILTIMSLVIGIWGLNKLSEFTELSQHKKTFCTYNFQVKDRYDTAESCFNEILNLKSMWDKNDASISRKLSLDNETEEMLRELNDERFTELTTSILDNTTAELEFEDSEIIKTFTDDGYLISCVGERYTEEKYNWAFSSFLTFFRDEDFGELDNIKYEYDCVYYICNTLYPKTFNQGIIDTFLSIGIHSWGSSGAETLDETISYVSSSPEGIKPYETYIATARKQLKEKDAIEDSKPKHYCVECGAKASYSYNHIFSGDKEWYCYSCYNELQELLDQFGIDG